MNNLEENISRIYKKFQQLLKQYQALQKENEHQSNTIRQLKEEKENNSKRIEALQQQISLLKTATGEMNETDKIEFEKIINKYLREIDKCINFLNE